MRKFNNILDPDYNPTYAEILDYKDHANRKSFSFSDAHDELSRIITSTNAEFDYIKVYDDSKVNERLKELEFECGYLNKECRIIAKQHYLGPSDDYINPEELRIVSGLFLATPQCFTFTQNPKTDRVEPCLISLSLLYNNPREEPEVIELFTPLKDIRVEIHSPILN